MRYQQPQGGPLAVDWSNPLTRALAILVNAGQQSTPYDVVGKRGISTAVAPFYVTSRKGRAYRNTQANSGAVLAGGTRLTTSTGVFTGEFSVSVYANPGSTGVPEIVYGPIGSAAPESYFQFNGTLVSAGGAGAAGRASFITPGGTGVEALTVTDGQFHMFTAIRRADNSLEMWVDGVLKATSTFTGAIATSARSDILFGYASGGFGCTSDVPLFAAHNRALLPAEVRSMHANPWQLIRTPKPIQLYQAPAAGGGVNGALSATLGSVTVASAGTVATVGTLTKTLGTLTAASGGTVAIVGAASKTLGAATLSADGTISAVGINGALTSTLGAASVTSAGAVSVAGAAAKTLGSITLSSDGTVANDGVNGSLSRTLGSVTSVSAGTLAIAGSAAITLGAVVLASGGALPVVGASSTTLGALTLVASDAEPIAPPIGGGGGVGGSGNVRDVRRFADLLDKARPTKTAKKRLRRVLEEEALELLPDEPEAIKAASIIAQVVAKKEIQAIERRPVTAAPLAALPFDPSAMIRQLVEEWLQDEAIRLELEAEDEYEVELLLMG